MSGPRQRVAPNTVQLDTEPLRAAHWLVLIMVAALLFAAWWMVAEPTTGRFERGLRRPVTDDRARIYDVATTDARRAGVILLGTSSMLENVLPDSDLSAQAGIAVSNLSVAGQSVLEALYSLYLADLHAGQLVVVMVTPNEMAVGYGTERLTGGLWEGPVLPFAEAFREEVPALEEFLTPAARREVAWAMQRRVLYRAVHDRIRVWAALNLYHDTRHPVHWRYRHDDKIIGHLRNQQSNREILQRGMRYGFAAHHAENARVLGVLLDFVRQRGAHAVLMAPPRIHGDSLVTYGADWATFRDDQRTVAQSRGVPWVDLDTAMRFSYTEFIDPMHMGLPARRRWTAAMIERLHEWCPDAGRRPGACR